MADTARTCAWHGTHALASARRSSAWVPWLRGEGSMTDDRLALPKACAPGHAHALAVTALTMATVVAHVATLPAHAWKPCQG